jgi:hypothetical protein
MSDERIAENDNFPAATPLAVRTQPGDGYRICPDGAPRGLLLFGAGEIDPSFGGSQIMVAYATRGASLGTAGFARIVVPGDKQGGQFVSNIVEIEVKDPTDAGLKMAGD